MSPIIKRLSPQECKKWTAESDGIAVGLPYVCLGHVAAPFTQRPRRLP